MRSLDLSQITSKADAEAALAQQIPQPEVRQFLLTNLRERNGWRWQPNLELINRSLPDIAGWPAVSGASFDGPTSWMVGQQSAYYRPEDIRLMQRYFPLVRTVVIPSAGHWVHADNPNAVIAAMAELSAASPR
jgi:pimeloyl-ACP methyl ester carboxylesterase